MGKLKSRTFWATVITAAYFALMAMREQGVNNTVCTIIYGALTAFVVFGYVALEKWLDHSSDEADDTVSGIIIEDEEIPTIDNSEEEEG